MNADYDVIEENVRLAARIRKVAVRRQGRVAECAGLVLGESRMLSLAPCRSCRGRWTRRAKGGGVVRGANDVSRLSPGVCFVRQASNVMRDVSSVSKDMIVR
jgi:hypothetical protein